MRRGERIEPYTRIRAVCAFACERTLYMCASVSHRRAALGTEYINVYRVSQKWTMSLKEVILE